MLKTLKLKSIIGQNTMYKLKIYYDNNKEIIMYTDSGISPRVLYHIPAAILLTPVPSYS